MTLMGSGDNHVPLVYVRDVARGAILAATAPEAVGRAYLLVNDERVTQREYVAAIASELGVPAPTRRIPYRLALAAAALAEWQAKVRRSAQPPVTRFGIQLLGGENQFVIDRARRELGFAPETGMEEGVRNAVAWFRVSEPDSLPTGSRS
jgi:nucleoside-diphosphate-sugar epimerase